ncbi:hypothetical protein OG393_03345 [Streptomyces sp. NBC_01216]|uniref:hypothetical protein n=1 Tax=Streptomyces sp. NBC_01216 TaxID=2903778 RepID=UPI002E13E020|nr:hypothetical protein OG393_03345 [Streptomyces sp. NBC_01216]
MIRIGRPRRFTRNLVIPVDLAGRQLLVKYNRNLEEAQQEQIGHRLLRARYRVPTLHASVRVPGGYLMTYECWAGGRNHGLLVDLLSANQVGNELTHYLDSLTDTYRETILATAVLTDPVRVVRKLYWDRAASGGRLDTYYAETGPSLTVADIEIPFDDLGEWALTINGQQAKLDWQTALKDLRVHFENTGPVWAALTQGDPTDVNLAVPLAWFDYDTAGMNCVLGEFANFLTYVTILGGWLVPTYNPAAFADHPSAIEHRPDNTPVITAQAVDAARRSAHITYERHLSAPRRAAAAAYWHRLVKPVAARLWPGQDLTALLRPYVAMRLIAVYNLGDLTPNDRLLVIIRLVEALSPSFDPTVYFHIEEAPCLPH